MRYSFILIIFLAFSGLISADVLTYEKALTNLKAIKSYEQGDFEKAEQSFRDNSIDYPEDGRLHYNLGNASYKKGDLDNAASQYEMALRNSKFKQQSNAWQNLGNVFFQQQDYNKALASFRNSVITDPHNEDARYNFELTRRLMQSQQNQQQKQNKDSDDKKDEEKEDKQQPQQGKQDDKQQKQEQQKQQQELKREKQKKEDAEKILQALLQKEKQERKKQKQPPQGVPRGKFW
ncbi:MAG: tetratricopeptide repeat protein [Candidatus Cloacimonetes bacterium]|nr:tetratricopeptide repeat protein [Candidatus Cloacimonadota bacterium]